MTEPEPLKGKVRIEDKYGHQPKYKHGKYYKEKDVRSAVEWHEQYICGLVDAKVLDPVTGRRLLDNLNKAFEDVI